jgi:predicted Zn-dependent peptidase
VRITVVPPDGGSVDVAAQQCRQLVQPLLQEHVTEADLQRKKLLAAVALVQAARSNAGMADLLSSYQSDFGSWKAVLQELKAIQSLTQDDLQSAAQQVFQEDNSFEALVPRMI